MLFIKADCEDSLRVFGRGETCSPFSCRTVSCCSCDMLFLCSGGWRGSIVGCAVGVAAAAAGPSCLGVSITGAGCAAMKVFCLLSLPPIGRYFLYHCFLWLLSQPSGMGPMKVRLLVWWRWSGVACSRRRAVYESGGSWFMMAEVEMLAGYMSVDGMEPANHMLRVS